MSLLHLADCTSSNVGTGTNPIEGAALGMSILESFASDSEGGACLTIASTHHAELKTLKYRNRNSHDLIHCAVLVAQSDLIKGKVSAINTRFAGLVPDILGLADADASSELCRTWGQVRDQQSLVFFDPGARANFITPQLAEKMGIKTDEMGLAYTASMAAPGHEVAVTPLIGKLRLHIQGYVGHEEFYIMPLEGGDVLLGMPWFYNHKAVLDSFNKTVSLPGYFINKEGELSQNKPTEREANVCRLRGSALLTRRRLRGPQGRRIGS
ncbi:hypothetical protein L7F22_063833 [Adiantum nelumboides]|nr:hypothetical protein [Adiantum nelumboides]